MAARCAASGNAEQVDCLRRPSRCSGGTDQAGTVTIPHGAMAFPLWREDW
jgi:hypothetical protein